MPDKMDALGTVRTGISSSRARRTRSVWVVALRSCQLHLEATRMLYNSPKWISNDKECDIFVLRAAKNLFAVGLDHFAVGHRDRSSIEGFLL